MKTRILVGYSTNRDLKAQRKFNKEIKASIGCPHEIVSYENDGSDSLTFVYNYIWDCTKIISGLYDQTIFVFCHHDIHFKNKGWGANLIRLFNENEVNIIGVAGTAKLSPHCVWWLDDDQQFSFKDLYGKVWHTDGKKEWKSDFSASKGCAKLQQAEAIDGLFIAVDPLSCNKFDEDFEGFHFYDISFCLANKDKNIAITETIQICHESGGNLSPEWENARLKLYKKYMQ
jgi:hypothetical protein